MKIIGRSMILRIIFFILCILTLIGSSILYRYSLIYNSITVVVSKNNKIEYGTGNYDVRELIDSTFGEVSGVVKDVDTNKVGSQEVILTVEKDNVVKKVPIEVLVVDSTAPVIKLESEDVYVYIGSSYDVTNNILSVVDNVDGELVYKSDVKKGDSSYYTVNGNVDINTLGSYSIEVSAVDKAKNMITKKFNVHVISNGKESSLRNIAYSLVGSPYAYYGMSPNGFDCSGFVKYVYARCGIFVGRSVSDQLFNGYEVSSSNMRLGDIIVWGYDRSHVTHTAIYVGNGLMIHAANPNEGVVVNKVNNWGSWTGVSIISVRRLK